MNKADVIDSIYAGLASLAALLARSEPDRNRQSALVRRMDCRRHRGFCRDRDVLMILLWLILIPLVAGVLAWASARWSASAARWIALIAVLIDFALALSLWIRQFPRGPRIPGSRKPIGRGFRSSASIFIWHSMA